MASQRGRAREWGLRLGLLAVTLVLLAGLLEIGTRIFSSQPPALKYSRPGIGEYYRPGYEGRIYVAEAGRKVPVRFNRDGFRGPDRPRKKPEGVRRVALMGDSFIAAISVDEEDTAAAVLERLLDESHPGERWEVLNFGISGAGTGTELALWRGLVREYEPDIVLLAFFVGNDITDNSAELDTKPRIYFELDDKGELRQRPYSSVQKTSSNWLNRHSRFYVWQKLALRRLRIRAQARLKYVTNGMYIFCPDPPDKFLRAWALTAVLLGQLRDEVETADSRFAVVFIPASVQIHDDQLQRFQETMGDLCTLAGTAPDRKMEAICSDLGIPLLLLTPAFRAAAPSHSMGRKDEWLFFQGSGHFNERGNRLAADEMHRFLAEETWRTDNGAGAG